MYAKSKSSILVMLKISTLVSAANYYISLKILLRYSFRQKIDFDEMLDFGRTIGGGCLTIVICVLALKLAIFSQSVLYVVLCFEMVDFSA